MDSFIGYNVMDGIVRFKQANAALAQHHCYIKDLIYIGYEARFVYHLGHFLADVLAEY